MTTTGCLDGPEADLNVWTLAEEMERGMVKSTAAQRQVARALLDVRAALKNACDLAMRLEGDGDRETYRGWMGELRKLSEDGTSHDAWEYVAQRLGRRT